MEKISKLGFNALSKLLKNPLITKNFFQTCVKFYLVVEYALKTSEGRLKDTAIDDELTEIISSKNAQISKLEKKLSDTINQLNEEKQK